ncbi:dicarboxylate:amino acid:cation symporter DAACS family protein [Ignatzschineria indica]|nr:dicarboxylate/amino acid:cation symporter [Ignatzschineria indica]GGZ82962.1 dicarboxylate:amino acid:cation symporter DAACS family protein [Ignatzschineria indica]
MIALWRWYRNKSFMLKITSGFILGLIFGLTLETTNEVFAPLGVIFMNLLKMIVIPLIFLSLIVAVNHSNPADLGRIGVKVFPIYVITTAISVAIGLIIATLLQPGKGVTFSNDITLTIPERQGFLDTIINMVPTNIFKAFADGHILSVVFMAIITGLAILYMTHSTDNKQQKMGNTLMTFVEAANEATLKILNGILEYAPIGIFGITAATIGAQGIDTVIALGKFIVTSYLGVILLLVVFYPLILKLWGGKVIQFYKDIKESMLTAFVTCSSLGTLPITLKAAKTAGIDDRIAKLTLPIGATVNMNGTALRLGIAVIFASEIIGVSLSPVDLVSIVVIGTLAAVGTAGVPGAGLIAMAAVFTQAGLPIEIVALTAGINILVDMIFTLGNVTGDLVAAKMVDLSERRYLAKQKQ